MCQFSPMPEKDRLITLRRCKVEWARPLRSLLSHDERWLLLVLSSCTRHKNCSISVRSTCSKNWHVGPSNAQATIDLSGHFSLCVFPQLRRLSFSPHIEQKVRINEARNEGSIRPKSRPITDDGCCNKSRLTC
jgi:hypothetical protein